MLETVPPAGPIEGFRAATYEPGPMRDPTKICDGARNHLAIRNATFPGRLVAIGFKVGESGVLQYGHPRTAVNLTIDEAHKTCEHMIHTEVTTPDPFSVGAFTLELETGVP